MKNQSFCLLIENSLLMSKKIVYDNKKTWVFKDQDQKIVAAYVPANDFDLQSLWNNLSQVPFTRVHYISKYHKANRTPRFTWAYGQVDANMPNPNFDPRNSEHQTSVLRVIPNPGAAQDPDLVHYRGLDFQSEAMPPWLESLAQYCRMTAIMAWGFDPSYNSVIIGKYEGGDDQIGFHTDDETFLAHHFCANVTIGEPRDFQFKTLNADGNKQTHEIKLANTSLFFFLGLEHALPARKGIPPGTIRYSISFRNMANNIGIGNSFYYCRGLNGAVDNENKAAYQAELQELQTAL
jgi:alkylated DNA repair dioxygenase AlkB